LKITQKRLIFRPSGLYDFPSISFCIKNAYYEHIPEMKEPVSERSAMYSASIIGASGYSGAELTRLLLQHPNIELQELFAFSQTGKHVSELYPALTCDKVYLPYNGETESDIYFLALPHGEALRLVPPLVAAGKTVIDLSGDFRLKNPLEHEQFYKQVKSPGSVMTYGMSELFRDEIIKAKAISNPGCFATSIILGVAPLFLGIESGMKVHTINCTSTSGISGAGRSSKTELSFSEMSENIRAYKVGVHQHIPEIMQALGTSATSPSFDFTFTPMIGSLVRGIYSILNIQLENPVDEDRIQAIYKSFYEGSPFVRVRDTMTEVRHVAHTNYCDVHIAHVTSGGSMVIVTAIDNLLKGAAGQAIQNMNLMLGFPETTGLSF
jgi:N-acetyl-gamma-glutamyl-phosphate reductase